MHPLLRRGLHLCVGVPCWPFSNPKMPPLSLPHMMTAPARYGFGRLLLGQLLFADGARFSHHVRHGLAPSAEPLDGRSRLRASSFGLVFEPIQVDATDPSPICLIKKAHTGGTRCPRRDGGPFKPSFGLSGAVPRLDRVFPLLARACVRSIRTRFQLVPRRPLRDGESCSTASLRGAHTIPASPDCNECSGASLQTAHDRER